MKCQFHMLRHTTSVFCGSLNDRLEYGLVGRNLVKHYSFFGARSRLGVFIESFACISGSLCVWHRQWRVLKSEGMCPGGATILLFATQTDNLMTY